jgi:hypothetical protein
MTRKRLLALLAFGLLTGLFLSACAGVAVGKVDFAQGNDLFLGGPLVDVQSLTFLDTVQPAQSAQFMFEKAVVEEVMQSQSQIQYNMLCMRGGH